MTLALVSKLENADLWRRTMAAEIPDVDFRVWPDLGDPTEIRMAAFDYNVPPGIFRDMPNLGCIVFLGHGVNYFLERPDVPRVCR
jgi:glyoxylate/hydroxypyruvate reductase A